MLVILGVGPAGPRYIYIFLVVCIIWPGDYSLQTQLQQIKCAVLPWTRSASMYSIVTTTTNPRSSVWSCLNHKPGILLRSLLEKDLLRDQSRYLITVSIPSSSNKKSCCYFESEDRPRTYGMSSSQRPLSTDPSDFRLVAWISRLLPSVLLRPGLTRFPRSLRRLSYHGKGIVIPPHAAGMLKVPSPQLQYVTREIFQRKLKPKQEP